MSDLREDLRSYIDHLANRAESETTPELASSGRTTRRRGWSALVAAMIVVVVVSVVLVVQRATTDRVVRSGASGASGARTPPVGPRPPTGVHAGYLPAGQRPASPGTVEIRLFGPAPGQPGSSPQNPVPAIPRVAAPAVTPVLDRGWLSPIPGTRRGIILRVDTGTPAVLQQQLALGGNHPLSQLGPRRVKLEVSPIVDESIAIWQERPGYDVTVNTRGIQTTDLQRFIAELRFSYSGS